MKRTIRKTATLLLLTTMTALVTHAQNSTDSINSVIERLSAAISKVDKSIIINHLSPNFAISTASWPSSEFHLGSILDSRHVESVTLQSISPSTADTILVNATFCLAGTKTETSIVALDKNYKILYIDLFDRLYGASRFDKSHKRGVVKFSMQNGSIIIPLKINNSQQTLNFLFDSGADGMAIRKSLADSLGMSINHTQSASVVGADLQISISRNNTIHLGDSLKLERQNIAIFDQVGHGTDGIIGLNMAQNYILQVNITDQKMTLYTPGDHQFTAPGESLTVTLPRGVILLPARLNLVGKTDISGRFAFDTGADYHLIGFEQFVRKNRLLVTGFRSEGTASTVSMGVVSPVFMGTASSFSIGRSIEFRQMPITLMGSTGRAPDPKVPDGSIGIRLIAQYNFTIDLLRKIVHLSPISTK